MLRFVDSNSLSRQERDMGEFVSLYLYLQKIIARKIKTERG
jgi:hypothetical protein